MKEKMATYLGWLLIALMALMTADVLWGVLTRYALGHQASWTEELARFLLIWIGCLGAAYAAGKDMHLSIDLLSPRLSPAGRQWLGVGIRLLTLLFAVSVLLVGGIELIRFTYLLGQYSPALNLPMSLVYAAVPLSGLLTAYFELAALVANYPRN